ncbi:hypothetical protein H4R20_004813 [Coemansia guatemalensis]|uniref:Non-structural maintenance of chromosomes element 1 homolog n=1 Tax=Coemansia guatemalensis TaxID=2761395 RepID=A0A9W8LSG1_9FUNG|nr:hypothetical protein H4R20_004813 [Coemansia guatemalensis]
MDVDTVEDHSGPTTTLEKQMLVQWCMSAQFFSETELQNNIKRILGDGHQGTAMEVIDQLNPTLEKFSLALRSSMSQTSGEQWWALISTNADGISMTASAYTAMELGILRQLIESVFTEPLGNYVIGLHQAVREATEKGPSSFSRREAQDLVMLFCRDGWLAIDDGRWVTIGQRACIELQQYLEDAYPEFVRTCGLCKQMATTGLMCGGCGAFAHPYCVDRLKFNATGAPSCPECRQQLNNSDAFGPGKSGIPHSAKLDSTQAQD